MYDITGKFIGVELTTLSQFEGGEEKFIKQKPYGTLDEVGGRGKTPYFGLRRVYVKGGSRGNSVEQALIDYLGSPAWINLTFSNHTLPTECVPV